MEPGRELWSAVCFWEGSADRKGREGRLPSFKVAGHPREQTACMEVAGKWEEELIMCQVELGAIH